MTIKARLKKPAFLLGYPNQEVSIGMARLYSQALLRQEAIVESGIAHLAFVMQTQKVDTVVDCFNRIFNSIDSHHYPIKDDISCRTYLQVLMLGAALLPHVETHNNDLEVDIGDRHWVLEFKFAEEDHDCEALLEEGIQQILKNRYGIAPAVKELIRVALVFSKQKRQIVAWKEV